MSSQPLFLSPQADEIERARLAVNRHVGRAVLPPLDDHRIRVAGRRHGWCFIIDRSEWSIAGQGTDREMVVHVFDHAADVYRAGKRIATRVRRRK